MKILVIRFSSIGDIVLTSPVVRCLKQQIPEAEVHFLTKSTFKSVLNANPYIDKLHVLEKTLSATIEELRKEEFDYVIDLHNNVRTKVLKFRLGVKSSSFNKLNIEKWLLVNLKIDRMPEKHIVDRYLEAVAFLGVKNDGKGLDFFFENEHQLEKLLPATHHNYIALVIGAQHATKRLPLPKLVEICKAMTRPIVLLGGKDDHINGEEIAKLVGSHVFNGCGKFSLEESSYIVKMADSVITHDTGLMHIASAFNKPIVSVWGNTVPELGMYPYKVDRHSLFEVNGLKCRPCSKIGYKKCPLGHFKCMNEHRAVDIAEKAQSI
ncbi:glycosyltransferase family 9 protein [Pedobacter sp. SYSU D00535]|uniref:glycosyltransferase family 9 protein n=1 Tax=Pedobacter sp. SYSU D00535 TaxID=2810308 RepID=UPI001A967901|nr:glycosyltransferase family 9 protein [Pedobacter sp. SYSU D00535]